MQGTVVINLPLNACLTKYLTHKFGNTHHVTRRSWLGVFLSEILSKDYKNTKTDFKQSSFYPVVIPSTMVKETGFHITTSKYKRLSDMIQKVFYNDLYSYIQVSIGSELQFCNPKHDTLNKQNIIKAISQFLGFFSITEEEVSADTIYRTFHREQENDKKKQLQNKELSRADKH